MSEGYEENRRIGPAWSWVLVIAFCALILAWGALVYSLVPDRGAPGGDLKRQWDFGALPDVPGQSPYSSQVAPAGVNPPRQVQPLPEAATQPTTGGTP